MEYVKQVLRKWARLPRSNEVLTSIRERELLSTNIYAELDAEQTFGDRLADKVAAFGGSWTFITVFFVILVGWIANSFLAWPGRTT